MRSNRVELLCGLLREELKDFPPGGRFYSIRELVRKFGFCHHTADAAVKLLIAEGILSSVPRGGLFRSCRNGSGIRHLLLLGVDYPVESDRIRRRIFARLAEESGAFRVSSRTFDYRSGGLSSLDLNGFQAVILFGSATCGSSAAFLHWLEQCPIPVIFGNIALETPWSWSVSVDSTVGSIIAASHFLAKGHRNLAVLLPEVPVLGHLRRVNAFVETVRQGGGEATVLCCDGMENGEYPANRAWERLRRELAANPLRFTGLFVLSDAAVPGVYRALKEFGFEVPRDVSVIGFDGLPSGATLAVPLTTVAIDFEEHAKALLTAAWDAAEGKPPSQRNWLLSPYLLERASVRQLTPD